MPVYNFGPLWLISLAKNITQSERKQICVRICVRKTFQNLLKLEKIGKDMENKI
jgi:hypothetical protein